MYFFTAYSDILNTVMALLVTLHALIFPQCGHSLSKTSSYILSFILNIVKTMF